MPMTLAQLKLHWQTEEADTLIELLDQIREVLWDAYGEEIITMRKEQSEQPPPPESQTIFEFDDTDIF